MMCPRVVPVVCLLAVTGTRFSSQAKPAEAVFNFDAARPGTLPAEWKVAGTNQQGPLATWLVLVDTTAPSGPNVLALSKSNHDSSGTYNLCWTDTAPVRDVIIDVAFKAVAGEEDQGGGPIWRVTDANNYYICRANPLEGNFRVYFVKDGARKQLASAKVNVASGQWHRIRVEHAGTHIVCWLSGTKYLEADDGTFTKAGGVGVWTKADAVTSFDDLRIQDAATGAPMRGAQSPSLDIAKIEQVTGLKGTLIAEEGVFKLTQPRSDVVVSVDGRPLGPFMGLTSWASFMPGKLPGVQAMVMGDLVLFQDEVNPVMSALLNLGLAVTALHNHFFYAEPSVYFMHIGGEGTQEGLAQGVRAALDKVKSIRAAAPQPASRRAAADVPATNSISADKVGAILGVPGAAKDGMFKAVIGREVKMPCGCTIGKEMGVNTWAAFAGSDDRAVVDGDFVTFEGELQPVLKALRAGGIEVVAIHNHMEGESPKTIFLHYWGVGPAEDLARTIKAALLAQEKARSK